MTNFLVFLLAYTLSQFFRAFLAVVAPELSRELGLNAADLGNISAIWFVVFALAQFPVGAALDLIGPRRTVSTLMLAAAAGTVAFAYAGSATECMIAIGLIGLGCSPVYMGALYVFGRLHAASRFGFLTSMLLGIGSAGNLLGATPLAWAVSSIGWRPTFLAIGAATLLSALLVLLLVRDPPRAERPAGAQGVLAGILEVISIRALWPILPLTATGYAIIAGERGLWIGPFLADVHGLDPVARGNIVLVMAIAMSVGALAYGPLEQWLGSRKGIVAIGSGLSGLGFLALGWWSKSDLATVTILIALIGGVGMTYGVLMAHARPFFPEHLLGRGITAMNFLFIGGAALLQPISGSYVALLQARGLPEAEVYASLHLAFGTVMMTTTAIYLLSREKR